MPGADLGLFEIFTLENLTLEGLKEHLESLPSAQWRVVLGGKSEARVTRMFENITLEALIHAVGQEFGVCGKVDTKSKTISFLPANACK